LLITVTVLIANFSVDILIAFLDPRVKAGLGKEKNENIFKSFKIAFFRHRHIFLPVHPFLCVPFRFIYPHLIAELNTTF